MTTGPNDKYFCCIIPVSLYMILPVYYNPGQQKYKVYVVEESPISKKI